MRFFLLDRIVELEPGEKIAALKALSLSEDYLADHFPRFPVMPGVLMLEAMTQAGAWLTRVTDDFRYSMVVLKEARNVKYADFVEPGKLLQVSAEMMKNEGDETKLKAQGHVDGRLAVQARLVLRKYNLVDENQDWEPNDRYVRRHLRRHYDLLLRPMTTNNQTATSGTA